MIDVIVKEVEASNQSNSEGATDADVPAEDRSGLRKGAGAIHGLSTLKLFSHTSHKGFGICRQKRGSRATSRYKVRQNTLYVAMPIRRGFVGGGGNRPASRHRRVDLLLVS